MFVKSMGLKQPGRARDLLSYILHDHGQGAPAWAVHWNLPDIRMDNVVRAFTENERYLPTRKNRVWRYHIIMAWHPEDAAVLTPAIQEDLTRKFLELRGPGALAYAQPHQGKDHPHVHICLSNNALGSKKAMRMSKAEFRAIQQELEAYQKQHYPQLRHSLVWELPKGPEVPKPTQEKGKDWLRARVQAAADLADGVTDFTAILVQQDIIPYNRGGQIAGVEYAGKRYRLKRLDGETAVRTLERLYRVQALRSGAQERDRER